MSHERFTEKQIITKLHEEDGEDIEMEPVQSTTIDDTTEAIEQEILKLEQSISQKNNHLIALSIIIAVLIAIWVFKMFA